MAIGVDAFVREVRTNNLVEQYIQNDMIPNAAYILALLEYLKRKENIEIESSYDKYSDIKADYMLYPPDVYILCKLKHSQKPMDEVKNKAIAEFLNRNIVEVNIYDYI